MNFFLDIDILASLAIVLLGKMPHSPCWQRYKTDAAKAKAQPVT